MFEPPSTRRRLFEKTPGQKRDPEREQGESPEMSRRKLELDTEDVTAIVKELQEDEEPEYWDIFGDTLDVKATHEGMKKELTQLKDLNVFEEMENPTPQQTKQAIRTRWVLKEKRPGEVRARLVLKDFNLGDKNAELFAPTPSLASLRLVLTQTSRMEHVSKDRTWGLSIADVNTAFLHADLDTEMFAVAPNEHCSLFDREVPSRPVIWRLKKALYGCRRSPRLWYEHLQRTLQKSGFYPTTGDPSLYVNKETQMMVLAHVDDLVISGPKEARGRLIEKLGEEVRVREESAINDVGQKGKILGRIVEKIH
jgi:hypothetical protein